MDLRVGEIGHHHACLIDVMVSCSGAHGAFETGDSYFCVSEEVKAVNAGNG